MAYAICYCEDIHPNLLKELELTEPHTSFPFVSIQSNEYLHLAICQYAEPISSEMSQLKYVKYKLPDFQIVNSYTDYNRSGFHLLSLIPTKTNNAFICYSQLDKYGYGNQNHLLFVGDNKTYEKNILLNTVNCASSYQENDLLVFNSPITVYNKLIENRELGSNESIHKLFDDLPYKTKHFLNPPLIVYNDSLLIGATYTWTDIPTDSKRLRLQNDYRTHVGVYIYDITSSRLISAKEYDLFNSKYVQSVSIPFTGMKMYSTDDQTITIIAGRSDGQRSKDICWFSVDFELNPLIDNKKEIIHGTDDISYNDPQIEYQLLRLYSEIVHPGKYYLDIDELGILYRLIFTRESFYFSDYKPIQAKGRKEFKNLIEKENPFINKDH